MRSRLFHRMTSLSLATLALLASSLQASAQTSFPTGTVRFVAPFSASTPPDIISRIVSKELTESEGWRVIVENRPGGVTTIAATDVLTQPADGNSLYAMSVPSAAAPSLVLAPAPALAFLKLRRPRSRRTTCAFVLSQ